MKTIRFILTLLLALLFSGKTFSQFTTWIFFTENGEKFTLFINGDPKNAKPQSRVQIDEMGAPNYKVRAVFENINIPEVSKTILNKIGGGDLFYVLRKNPKGVYVFEKTSYDYSKHTKESTEAKPAVKAKPSEKEKSTSEESKKSGPSHKKGGCDSPMDEPAFQVALAATSSAPFDPPKLSHAKNVAEKNCLTTTQITSFMYEFSTEGTRLSFAKFAYSHCYNPDNYSDVKEALRSGKSKAELQQFIDAAK